MGYKKSCFEMFFTYQSIYFAYGTSYVCGLQGPGQYVYEQLDESKHTAKCHKCFFFFI